ncbi:MAG: hypothetical protein IPK69_07730 [Phycisphaerales bacterium]|nr:MAG: hypothetical protein IPK69_07730 [Phycisphaerales bacterium]
MMNARTLTLVLAAGLLTGVSFAEPSAKADPLAGPKVTDHSVPGETRTLGTSETKARVRAIPHMAFMRVINSLRGEEAGDLRLSSEQSTSIDAIAADLRTQFQAFRAEHEDEIRTLLDEMPPEARERVLQRLGQEFDLRGERGPGANEGARRGGAKGGPKDGKDAGERGRRGPRGDRPMPPKGDEMMAPPRDGGPGEKGGKRNVDPEKAKEMRDKVQSLIEKAPDTRETHAKIFAVLTEAQREHVTQKLEEVRHRMEGAADKRIGEERAKREGDQFDKGREAVREALSKLSPEERRAIMEKMRSMSPEERREFIQQKLGELNATK